MVPFSFENIARSAGLDALDPYPVSAAARATQDSFESHLQRAAAPATNPSPRRPAREDRPHEQSDQASNEPPQNEPVRQDAGEVSRDGDDVRQDGPEKATTASEPVVETDHENVKQDSAVEDEAVATTAEGRQITIQELTLEEFSNSNDEPDEATADRLAEISLDEGEAELDTSPVTNAEESDGDTSDSMQVNRQESESTRNVRAESSDPIAEMIDSSEEVVTQEQREEANVPETTIQDDETPKTSTAPRRRGDRGDAAAIPPADDTADAIAKPVDADVIETAADTAGEDSSRQRRNTKDVDVPQSVGNSNTADVTTPTPGTPSRFAQHLLAKTGDPNARALSITDADQARFVDRVARAVQATGDRGGTLRLRLSPPELGSLTLEVKVQGGAVSARVEADTPAARSLLLENLSLLRERLAEQGMRVDQFDVDLNDRHTGGTPDGLQQNDQQQEDRPQPDTNSHEPDDTAPATSNDTQTRNGNEQLNIIV